MRSFFFLGLFIVSNWLCASEVLDEIAIGILEPYRPATVQIIPEKGAYSVIGDGVKKLSLKASERITLKYEGGKVFLKAGDRVIGSFGRVKLESLQDSSYFRIYLLSPKKGEFVYDDNLEITPKRNQLKLVNLVNLEKYVAGVVEAETGKEKELEFYKVQAIISRTYALSNRRKHLQEGFNLNDQVACQVYHGKCRWEPLILEAVKQTEGKVLVDSEMRLITAAFHSNSGGETVGSDVVWSGPLPYLSPKRDEFSLVGEHYRWERKIEKAKWLGYLKDKYRLAVEDELIEKLATSYQQKHRQIFFIDPSFDIPLTEIRKDWSLKSTFFDIFNEEDSIRIEGRGFGHGTGLSQEGAMRMAELGFSAKDILHFYYNDIHLIDLHALQFFRKE